MQTNMKGEIEEMDRISHLPDFIVHHILSLLDPYISNTPAELVRMSVLSKTWFNLTASFPNLIFCIHSFQRSRETFFRYVEYTTSRFCNHKDHVTARRVVIRTTIQKPVELDIVSRCVELVFEKGVSELDIDIVHLSDVPRYSLPNALLSVSVLTSLNIGYCDLPSSLMLDDIKFKSLIRLTLKDVPIDDEVIKRFTTSCPLLQVFWVVACRGFQRFCVHRHQNLKQVMICYNTPIERIDIEAPNLSTLIISGSALPQMNVASCKKLTSVTYNGHPLPDTYGFLSNFPFVEDLVVNATSRCNGVKLSSHSLRTLGLHSYCDLEETELSTPNLGLFVYSCNSVNLWDKKIRKLPHLKACMQCYLDDSIDAFWFQKLRFFLEKKKGFRALNLYIHANQIFIEIERLKEIELPRYELEHIELHYLHEESLDCAAFVDAVLWCFRPRSLTLRSTLSLTDFEEQNDLVKFTYEKLLEQEDQGHTNIQIVSPYSSKAQKQFRGLMSLFPSPFFPRDEKAISFIKEDDGTN